MADDLVCWRCGAGLQGVPLPLRRAEECPSCGADLHVCRMCEFYDPQVADSCREPVAERVANKERANFCDYLRLRPGAWSPHQEGQSRNELEALFGGTPVQHSPTDADEARAELERLFADKGKRAVSAPKAPPGVEAAVRTRASTRAFLDRAVTREEVEAILDAARYSPSGGNLQPWQVAVVSGSSRARLSEQLRGARAAGTAEHPDYLYYPAHWREPYLGRRRACGYALYGALGIAREDKVRRARQWDANFDFFGAPVGLLFFLERGMSHGAWVDLGIFLQSIMLLALEQGLATCPQAALADYPDVVRSVLGVSEELILVCGMALGYPDREHPVNRYRTAREALASFCRWYD